MTRCIHDSSAGAKNAGGDSKTCGLGSPGTVKNAMSKRKG